MLPMHMSIREEHFFLIDLRLRFFKYEMFKIFVLFIKKWKFFSRINSKYIFVAFVYMIKISCKKNIFAQYKQKLSFLQRYVSRASRDHREMSRKFRDFFAENFFAEIPDRFPQFFTEQTKNSTSASKKIIPQQQRRNSSNNIVFLLSPRLIHFHITARFPPDYTVYNTFSQYFPGNFRGTNGARGTCKWNKRSGSVSGRGREKTPVRII